MTCLAVQVPVQTDLSTTALLRGLASEISGVAIDCRALEIIIGEVFADVPKVHLLQQLQALDLIIQRIDGAATVLDAMANHAPPALVSADQVLGRVSLADLAARLSGANHSAAAASGELEIW